MTLERRVAWEARFGDGLFLATILWIIFGAFPTIGLLVGPVSYTHLTLPTIYSV